MKAAAINQSYVLASLISLFYHCAVFPLAPLSDTKDEAIA